MDFTDPIEEREFHKLLKMLDDKRVQDKLIAVVLSRVQVMDRSGVPFTIQINPKKED